MEREVVVIGAGAAGIGAAAMLARRGIGSAVLERGGHVGESWRHRYDGLKLNTVRWMSSLPGYVMERRYGDWPARDDWADYLERYAARHSLDVEHGVEARRVERDGDGWRVETTRGARRCGFVVVASGMDHTPLVPDWPGRDDFAGRLLHSADYRNAGDHAGQDVMVVGAGNSATEIADQLARGPARRVWVAIRTPPLILPRKLLGISATAWAIPALPLPDRVIDAVSRAAQRRAFGDLTAFGLPPSPRGISAQRRTGYVAPLDSGFVESVKTGAVEVVPAVEGFDGADVILAGGRRVAPGAVIAATGYRTGLEPIVGHLGVLGSDERPRVYGGAEAPAAPGLYFAGYHYKLIPTLPHMSTEALGIARSVARRLGQPMASGSSPSGLV